MVPAGASSQIPVKRNTGTRGNLGDGVTFLSLGVHRIDDDRVTTLERHEGAFAAYRIDDGRNLRGIRRARKPLLAADAEQTLALDVAPHERRAWKRTDLRRKGLRHARLAAARQPADGDELRPLSFKMIAREQNIGGRAGVPLSSRLRLKAPPAATQPWP